MTGLPTLKQYQDKKRVTKRAKVKGVQVETFVELQKWATDHLLPDTFNEMVPYQT